MEEQGENDMRENEKAMNDIKSILVKFQQEYTKNNVDALDRFVREFFINEEDTGLIGTGLNSWHFGLAQIKDGIKSYWMDDSKHLKNIEMDIDNSIINVEGRIATIAVTGKSIKNISEHKMCGYMVDKLTRELEGVTKGELIRLSNEALRTLYDINLGEDYAWPFKVTMVMINNGFKWMIKFMNISFGGLGTEVTFDNRNIEDKFKIIPIKSKESIENKKIMELLGAFQEAYDKRDVNLVDIYTEKLLDNDGRVSIFGTNEGENFYSFDDSKELFEGDWKYWGDFNLNRENVYIWVCDNMAVVCSKAFIKYKYEEKGACTWPKLNLDYYLEEKNSNKELLYKVLLSINNSLDVIENCNENSIEPMKFVGVLVKREGKWKFKHMHFSDVVDNRPKERIFV